MPSMVRALQGAATHGPDLGLLVTDGDWTTDSFLEASDLQQFTGLRKIRTSHDCALHCLK
jgi:hypothetical protein